MYVVLAFGGVPFLSSCPMLQQGDVMRWIELGGMTYVVGIVFFLLDKRYPAMHVIWHLLVALGAFFHFMAVFNLTKEVMNDPSRRIYQDQGILGFGGIPEFVVGSGTNRTTEFQALAEARQ